MKSLYPYSVPTPTDVLEVLKLREQLITVTVALADHLAAEGDVDRLGALIDLYVATADALQARDHRVRGAR